MDNCLVLATPSYLSVSEMAGEAQHNQADLPQQSPKDSAVIYDNTCCLYKYTLIKIVVRWIQDGHTIE